MEEPNQLVLDREKYKTEEEFAKAMGEAILLITKNGNVVVIRYEDCGIYVLDYEHDPNSESDDWGDIRPVWLSAEEEEQIMSERMNQEFVDEADTTEPEESSDPENTTKWVS